MAFNTIEVSAIECQECGKDLQIYTDPDGDTWLECPDVEDNCLAHTLFLYDPETKTLR